VSLGLTHLLIEFRDRDSQEGWCDSAFDEDWLTVCPSAYMDSARPAIEPHKGRSILPELVPRQ